MHDWVVCSAERRKRLQKVPEASCQMDNYNLHFTKPRVNIALLHYSNITMSARKVNPEYTDTVTLFNKKEPMSCVPAFPVHILS